MYVNVSIFKVMFELNLSRKEMLTVQDYAKARHGSQKNYYPDPKVTLRKVKEACDRKKDNFWICKEYKSAEGINDLPQQTVQVQVITIYLPTSYLYYLTSCKVFRHCLRVCGDAIRS